MTAREHAKWFLAGSAIAVYFIAPGYKYYVIGSWIAYKIMQDKQRYRVVPKSSKAYHRIMAS